VVLSSVENVEHFVGDKNKNIAFCLDTSISEHHFFFDTWLGFFGPGEGNGVSHYWSV